MPRTSAHIAAVLVSAILLQGVLAVVARRANWRSSDSALPECEWEVEAEECIPAEDPDRLHPLAITPKTFSLATDQLYTERVVALEILRPAKSVIFFAPSRAPPAAGELLRLAS